MSNRIWKRMRWIYFVHLSVLISVLLIAWPLAGELAPVENHFHEFLLHRLRDLALSPLLLNQPPLFDILPLYIAFLAVTPPMLFVARRYGWGVVLAVSALCWVAVQTHLESQLIGDSLDSLPLGSFNLLAWQFLWATGVMLGEMSVRRPVWPSSLRDF